MLYRFIVIGIALLATAGCGGATPAPAPTAVPTAAIVTPAPGTLFVDATQSLGEVSPFGLGTNFTSSMVVMPGMVTEFEDSGVTLLRFQGADWGDSFDISHERFDHFMEQARTLNAEPLVNVRMRGSSAEDAAELVRYAKDKGYGVRYWGIGNEPDRYAFRAPADPRWDTEYYNQQWRLFAGAMRAADPTISLIGPDIDAFDADEDANPKDAQGRDWLREFLRANGDMVDMVTVHRFPFPLGDTHPPPTTSELFAEAPRWTPMIRKLRAIVREELKRDLPIGITEWNSDWAGMTGAEATPDSINGALWTGDVLGQLLRERVDVAGHWLLMSPPGGSGLFSAFKVYPAYYVFQLYKRFGTIVIQAESDVPGVSIYAARRKDGSLTLMVVNFNAAPVSAPLQLSGFQPNGKGVMWQFDAEHNADKIGAVEVANGAVLEIPKRSMLLYEIVGF